MEHLAKKALPVIKELLITCAWALAIALFCNWFIVVSATVPTESMKPTLSPGDRMIGTRFSYWLADPKRGDVIVFWAPDEDNVRYVKRVIGLPSETVELRAGKLYVDGVFNDTFAQLDNATAGDWGPYAVPENAYFVMGDNRNHSWDSRFWSNTFVPRKRVIGKVLFRYWPALKWVTGS